MLVACEVGECISALLFLVFSSNRLFRGVREGNKEDDEAWMNKVPCKSGKNDWEPSVLDIETKADLENGQRPDRRTMLRNLPLAVCRNFSSLALERSPPTDPCPNAQSCVSQDVNRFVLVAGSSTHPSRIARMGFHNAEKTFSSSSIVSAQDPSWTSFWNMIYRLYNVSIQPFPCPSYECEVSRLAPFAKPWS